jgi:hypothetical protein
MTETLPVFLSLHAAAFAWVLWFFRDAPEGYETDAGFHIGREPTPPVTDDQTLP